MKSLQELRSLVSLARRFGQEPAAELLEQIDMLEKDEEKRILREQQIKGRIADDLNQIFQGVKIEPGQTIPIKDIPGLSETIAKGLQEGVIEVSGSESQPAAPGVPEAAQQPNIADQVAKVISEAGVVAPDPVLARPQKNLELEIKRLEKWISRIAATGAGSGEVNFRYLDDVERSSIDEDKYLAYNATTKKFFFDDTRCSIEAFDRSTSIALLATPQLLQPSSFTNSKNITYDSSTGVFTFLRQCEVNLALTVNALANAAGQRVYQYAERNTGSGWVPIVNSGKSYQLTNTQHTQIVNAQTVSRQAGEQIRYFIYASDVNKVDLVTETLPNVTGNTVYIPAIRIQYAGR